MKILVLNCGSSSIKYQLFDMRDKSVLVRGLVNRIGLSGSSIEHRKSSPTKKFELITEILDHKDGVEKVLDLIRHPEHGVMDNLNEILAVGHRVVNGGEKFTKSALIRPEILEAIRDCVVFAPLHNPPNLKGIEAIMELVPKVPQVAVFDTSFHQTMEPFVYLYGLPYSLYEKDRIRRYGYHGMSHRYVSRRASELLGKPFTQTRLITIHLGNGSSITAIRNGASMDTSMGHTPLEGLIMGTRSGDVDAALVLYIMKKYELTIKETENMLNKHSGVLGMSGISSDFRDLEDGWPHKSERANLAIDAFTYRIKKYIGAYIASMNGCDAIVFTAGIGENSHTIRSLVCKDMDFLGIEIDPEKNQMCIEGTEKDISAANAGVRTLVIPTNEELVIAEDTFGLVKPGEN